MDHNVLLNELNNLDVNPHLVRWIAAVSGLGLGIRYLPLLDSMLGHHREPNSPPCFSAFW